MKQIFVSHTKEDEDFCDAFDRICSGVGIKRFRSEFEEITSPSWKAIKNAMNNSIALVFLVGKKLVSRQLQKSDNWEHTQNWISYEIGLACQLGIDVWAICDNVSINFPMPYINNYLTVSLTQKDAFTYMRRILEEYLNNRNYPYPSNSVMTGRPTGITCPYKDCKMEFNLHVRIKPEGKIVCPQCLRTMVFKKGHLF